MEERRVIKSYATRLVGRIDVMRQFQSCNDPDEWGVVLQLIQECANIVNDISQQYRLLLSRGPNRPFQAE